MSTVEQYSKDFVGLKRLLKESNDILLESEQGIIYYYGKNGCGKTALMVSSLFAFISLSYYF